MTRWETRVRNLLHKRNPFLQMKLRTQYVGPIHPIDTPKKKVRTQSANSLQLSHLVVEQYRNTDVTFEEKENGFNSFMRIDYRIRKLGQNFLSVCGSGDSSSAASTPGMSRIQLRREFFPWMTLQIYNFFISLMQISSFNQQVSFKHFWPMRLERIKRECV